ncbi:MAG: secretin N-terminal domain-containing protein [bacterium]
MLYFLYGAVFANRLIEKIEFIDASVLDVVQALAQQSELDLVISGDASLVQNRRTSVNLTNITAELALDHVLKTNGIPHEYQGATLLISLAVGQEDDLSAEILVIDLKYLNAEKVVDLLSKIFPSLKASVGAGANVVILQGTPALTAKARKLVFSIDEPIPQVLIESKVLEISESDSMRLGLSYGGQAGFFQVGEDLQAAVNSLVTEGKAKVVATPKIATLNDHEAIINIGSRIPYAVPVSNGSGATQWAVEYIDAGVKLKITPRIGDEGSITSFIQPEVSSVSEWRTTSAGEFPVITTRNAQATLRVSDGETIVVGGLLSETDRENISRLPILGYIPIVGMVFQNKTIEKAKTEIVFLITPHII